VEQAFSPSNQSPSGDTRRQASLPSSSKPQADIPIFCAGGCGEVVGYLAREGAAAIPGKAGLNQWCPTCREANSAKNNVAEFSLESTDELAEIRGPTRHLGWLNLMQAMIVAVIIAGSVCIALGYSVGTYVAALGTIAWFVVSVVLRKLRN
jgi:hypothetical protein